MGYDHVMTSAATATLSYRKTKAGKWAVMGPASIVQPMHNVTVTKKDGTTKPELIGSVGRTFMVDGVEMVYGYPAERVSRGGGRSYGADVDHEDCLSFSRCVVGRGRCDYH